MRAYRPCPATAVYGAVPPRGAAKWGACTNRSIKPQHGSRLSKPRKVGHSLGRVQAHCFRQVRAPTWRLLRGWGRALRRRRRCASAVAPTSQAYKHTKREATLYLWTGSMRWDALGRVQTA